MDKRIYILSIILLSVVTQVVAQDSLLQKGNRLYQKEEFEKAIETYQKLVEKNYESAGLYYNLGNAYFKSHQLGPAILYYERAKLLAPNDDDIQYNLEMARNLTVDNIEKIPPVFIKRWYTRLIRSFVPKTWGLLSQIMFVAGLAFLLVYFLVNRLALKRAGLWLGGILLLLSVASWTFGMSYQNRISDHSRAIIMSPSVTVKSTPDESGNNLFTIHEGTRITVEDSLENWREIRLSDGKKGWLRVSDMEEI